MTRRRLYNTLLALLTIIAAISLARLVWQIVAPFTDILLLFAAAWLIAFILRPLGTWITHSAPAHNLVMAVRRRWGNARAEIVIQLLDPLAVTLIYLILLAAVIVALVAIFPTIIREARQLGMTLADTLKKLPDWLAVLEKDIASRFETSPELLSRLYQLPDVNQQIGVLTEGIPRVIAGLIRGIASGIGNVLLTLAISYYLMLDGPRLARQIYDLTPQRFHDEYDLVVSTVSRTFGGFLRGQLVMALLSGIVSGIAAGVAGLRYGAIIGALAGLIIFIPILGAPIAMFLPSLIALLQGASLLTALLLLAFLTAFQQILLHLVVPRIMSESIGMPTVLIVLSTLIGARLWGMWGFIFGIPVARAIYTTALVMLGRLKREQIGWTKSAKFRKTESVRGCVSDLSRNNRLMMLALFLWASGEGLFAFIQPIYIQQLGATPAQIGGVLALAGFGLTLAYLPGGILADRAPRKALLLAGWVLGIVGALMLAFARDWRGAIPGILIYSLSALCVPAISLTIADSAGHAPLARVLTLTYAGYWAGNIVSPWVGGWLARLTNMRTVYIVAAACFAASTLAMLLISVNPKRESTRTITRPSMASLRLGAGLGSIVFIMFLSMYIGLPLAPNFLQNTAGWPVERIGLLGSLNALGVTLLSPALGRWSARHTQRGLWAAQALMWASFAVLLIGVSGLPALIYLAFLLRSGYSACRSLTNAAIAERIPAENRGLAFGLAEASVALAQMVAPYLAGQLYSRLPAAPMWAGLALIPIGMLISMPLGKSHGPSLTADSPSTI